MHFKSFLAGFKQASYLWSCIHHMWMIKGGTAACVCEMAPRQTESVPPAVSELPVAAKGGLVWMRGSAPSPLPAPYWQHTARSSRAPPRTTHIKTLIPYREASLKYRTQKRQFPMWSWRTGSRKQLTRRYHCSASTGTLANNGAVYKVPATNMYKGAHSCVTFHYYFYTDKLHYPRTVSAHLAKREANTGLLHAQPPLPANPS